MWTIKSFIAPKIINCEKSFVMFFALNQDFCLSEFINNLRFNRSGIMRPVCWQLHKYFSTLKGSQMNDKSIFFCKSQF